jgi:protein-tyrosine-phosphatase
MRVILVCENNVARSYCAQRVLSPLYSDLQIVSAGTNISSERLEYPWRKVFLSELGILDDNSSPTSVMHYLEGLETNDVIIASDQKVYESIHPNIANFSRLFSLNDLGVQNWAIPKNPKFFPRYEMTVATTKALISYRYGIEKILETVPDINRSRVVFWQDRISQAEIVERIKTEIGLGRSVISLHPLDLTGIDHRWIKSFNTLDDLSICVGQEIYIPNYEDPHLIRKLISPDFAKKFKVFSRSAEYLTILGGQLYSEGSMNRTNLLAGMISATWEVI